MKYFKNLETMEEVKKQYRKLAMKFHPDRGGDEEIFKKMAMLANFVINYI